MGKVLDVLYGGNLGCEPLKNLFDITSQVLKIEHELSETQTQFPPTLSLVQAEDITREPEASLPILKFRVILTLRYHNLRILTHRPIFHKYLEAVGSQDDSIQQISILHQIGANSLRTCVQSATVIIELVAQNVRSSVGARSLLGAWWFTLYYSR